MQENKSKNVHFAALLSTLLDERGMTNAQLAELIQVTPTSVGNYRQGREPKSGELFRLSKVFGVTMEELLTGKIGIKSDASDAVLKIQLDNERQKFEAMKAGLEAVLKKFS